jgi:chromosome segregation ATPase
LSGSEPETPKPNAVDQEVTNALDNLKAENEKLRQEDAQTKRQYMDLLENSAATIGNLNKELEEARSQLATAQAEKEAQEQAATENTRYYAGVMNEAGAKIGRIEKELAEARSQLATLAADREELAQLKKEAKEAAAEVHREARAMEVEKARWQRELSDARVELEDAKATMLKQGDKIRELERGYSLKPNPAESRLRLEIGNLREELEASKQVQPTIDLSEQVAQTINFLKELLPPDTKWPKRVMPKLREYLESKED